MAGGWDDPYEDAAYAASGDFIVRSLVSIITAAIEDDAGKGKKIAAAWLAAIDLSYGEARDPEQMRTLVGLRSEIVAASTPLKMLPVRQTGP